MAEVENNENVAFAILMYAFHIGGLIHLLLSTGMAKTYPFPFCLWVPLVAFLKKSQSYHQIQGP